MPSTLRAPRTLDPGADATRSFLNDVLDGLGASPKHLPCKYFYDARGSILFDRICELDEYYLTRVELGLMEAFAPEMGARLGPDTMLVEYGSGSSVKTRCLLDALTDPAAYVPVDISGEYLQTTARELARDYPEIEVLPVCADFTRRFSLPRPANPPTRVSVYFPGSTIGNFQPDQAAGLLRKIAAQCGARNGDHDRDHGGGLLIGIDLKKDAAVLEAAYNDQLGATAAFNLNLLARINREIGADFDLECFEHRAIYNKAVGRIEMHLVSRRPQRVRVGGEAIMFSRGETICTEYSYKYETAEFAALAAGAGLALDCEWTDAGRNFAVLYFHGGGRV